MFRETTRASNFSNSERGQGETIKREFGLDRNL